MTFAKWARKRLPTLLRFFKQTVVEWNNDNATRWSASVAFYSLLSLAPLLILTVAIASLVYGPALARAELVGALQHVTGFDMGPVADVLLPGAAKRSSGGMAAFLGSLVLLFGASTVMVELRDSLNAIWHAPPHQAPSGWPDLFHLASERVYSFVLVLAMGLLLLVSLLLNTSLAALAVTYRIPHLTNGYLPRAAFFALTVAALALLFAAIYKFVPDVRLSWKEVGVGGLVTSLLFNIGKEAITVYVNETRLSSAYGAAGSLVVVVVWVYYSAQVFFLGAEFTKVYAETAGASRGKRLLERWL